MGLKAKSVHAVKPGSHLVISQRIRPTDHRKAGVIVGAINVNQRDSKES